MTLADYATRHFTSGLVVLAVATLVAVVFRFVGRGEARSLRITFALIAAAYIAAAVAAFDADPEGAHMAAALAMVLGGFAIVQVAAAVVFQSLLPALGSMMPRIAHDLTAAALSLGWAFLCLRLGGMDPSQLFATSALVTALVAFSIQDTLGNVLGGVVVQLDNSLRVGDWLRTDDVNGQVVDVRWRYATVQTRHGEQIVVPNTTLMKNRFFVIRAREDGTHEPWRRAIVLQVDAKEEPTTVIATLEQCVRDAEIDHVLEQPPPTALLTDVMPGYGRYTLRYWLADPRFDDLTDSAVRIHALAALARAGMRVGVPQEERLVIKDDEDWRTAQQQVEARRRLDAIRRTDLFAQLPAAEQEALASHLVHAPFAPGDTMTREGAVAHWLYLIVHGEARVVATGPGGPIEVGKLTSGSVFGEMGMLTGEPRSATVIATTAVDCYRLDKVGFAEVLRTRPEIATEISSVVEARNAQRNARLQEAGAAVRPQHGDVLERILKFFSLR